MEREGEGSAEGGGGACFEGQESTRGGGWSVDRPQVVCRQWTPGRRVHTRTWLSTHANEPLEADRRLNRLRVYGGRKGNSLNVG